MPHDRQGPATWARLAALGLLWGSGFLLIKLALRGFTPYQIVLAQVALGAAVLIGYLYATKRYLPRGRRTWLHLAVAALLANLAPYLLFAIAERQIDSAVAGVLNATTPLFTVIVAVVVGHEARPTHLRLIGLIVGIAGTAILLAPWKSGTQFTSWGALAALAGSLCYAVSYVYMDRFLVSRGLAPVALAGSQLLAASALALLGLPLTHASTAPTWRLDALLALLALGVLSTGVAYVLNYRIITDDGASTASLVTYLIPVTALVLGAIVLREAPMVHAVVGMAIVLIGVALARRDVSSASGRAKQANKTHP
jgi:drug/metabolite transporter (DMT)-like permease